jgi:hypothetical protein
MAAGGPAGKASLLPDAGVHGWCEAVMPGRILKHEGIVHHHGVEWFTSEVEPPIMVINETVPLCRPRKQGTGHKHGQEQGSK